MIPFDPSGLETQARRQGPVPELEVDRGIAGHAENSHVPVVGCGLGWGALAEDDDVPFPGRLVHRTVPAELALLSLHIHAQQEHRRRMNASAQTSAQSVGQGLRIEPRALVAEGVQLAIMVVAQRGRHAHAGTIVEQAAVADEDAAKRGVVVLRAQIGGIAGRDGSLQVIVRGEKGRGHLLVLAQAQGGPRLVVVVARDGKESPMSAEVTSGITRSR